MNKVFHTNKILIAIFILSLAFFALPLSAFARGAFVYHHKGDIEGLYFAFGEGTQGLPVTLAGLGEVAVLDVLVEASGRETLIITPFGRYIYHAKVNEGIGGTEKGKIYASAYVPNWNATEELVFEFDWARLSENFMIEGEIPEDPGDIVVPDDVNLLFKVNGARLIAPMETEDTFNLMFRIRRGDLQFLMIW